jgi:hypothetical protein
LATATLKASKGVEIGINSHITATKAIFLACLENYRGELAQRFSLASTGNSLIRSKNHCLNSLWKFIAIGSIFATVEEFLTVALLKRDIGAYLFTLLILFPIFLALVYFSSRWLNRLSNSQLQQELTHFITYGLAGLIIIEWLLIGFTPAKTIPAHPILGSLFQVGMFSFWSTVAFAPRLILNRDDLSRVIARKMLRFYTAYFIIVYIIAFALPRDKRFGPVVTLIICGYFTMNLWFARYFHLRRYARP